MPATSFADAPATRLLKSNYSGVYGRLVELPWTQDSITDTEHDAIEWLYWLSSRNWQAAVALLDLPWVQDSITETEADAIEWVYWLAEEDRRAVAEVIAKPFLKTLEADDVQTIREMTGRNSESYLGQIERWYPAVAEPLRGLSWPQPPYAETEIDAIEWLYQMAREDEESAATVAAMPWVQDGMTHTEREAIKRIYYLMRESKDLAAKVIALPWIQDDITDTERNTIRQIDNVLEKDDEYGEAFIETIVGLPWIQDGITETEGEFVDIFEGLDDQSEKAAATVIAMPWVQDGITETEAEALKYLNWISGRNADAAAALIAMPFLESVEIRDTLALRSLNHISGKDASDFRELMSYPRIKDGITDEDTKIVAVLGGRTYSDAPGAAEILLAETGAYIQERLIVLPHTGETLLAVIRTQDKVTPSMDYLEHAVRTIERFMGAPFPIYYLALLYYDGERIGANNNFTHLLINAEDDVVDGPEWQGTPSLIAHETAHWYWYRSTSSNPYKKWISEGSADFLRIISEHERVGRPLEPQKGPCRYFDNINELEEKASQERFLSSGERNPANTCWYSLGQRFFLDLYLDLGDETFRPAYRALYLKSQQDDPTDNCEGTALNLCHVEAAFKDGASADVIRKVDEVIDRWYYGR